MKGSPQPEPPRVVYEGARLRIGRFRARPEDRWFSDSGPASGYLVVFPRTAVAIRHSGAERLVADPTRVLFYNRGQEYERSPIAPAGDRCEFFSFDPQDVIEAVSAFEPSVTERPARPFALPDGPSDAQSYAAQRIVFERVLRGAEVEALEVEETSLLLLRRVVAAAHRARGVASRRRPGAVARARHTALAEHVRETLGRRFAEPLTLDDLASGAGVSPFHLCRVFRAVTGRTLHAHRDALRARAALECVAEGARDLTAVALDVGYSSHSHFTRAFRQQLGATPSRVRALARGGPRSALLALLGDAWRGRARS